MTRPNFFLTYLKHLIKVIFMALLSICHCNSSTYVNKTDMKFSSMDTHPSQYLHFDYPSFCSIVSIYKCNIHYHAYIPLQCSCHTILNTCMDLCIIWILRDKFLWLRLIINVIICRFVASFAFHNFIFVCKCFMWFRAWLFIDSIWGI